MRVNQISYCKTERRFLQFFVWQNLHHFPFKTPKKSVETSPKVTIASEKISNLHQGPKITKSYEKHRDIMRSPLAPKSPVTTDKVL